MIREPSDAGIMFEWSQTPSTGDMRVDLVVFARALLAKYAPQVAQGDERDDMIKAYLQEIAILHDAVTELHEDIAALSRQPSAGVAKTELSTAQLEAGLRSVAKSIGPACTQLMNEAIDAAIAAKGTK